jgi:hypothetical protein
MYGTRPHSSGHCRVSSDGKQALRFQVFDRFEIGDVETARRGRAPGPKYQKGTVYHIIAPCRYHKDNQVHLPAVSKQKTFCVGATNTRHRQ